MRLKFTTAALMDLEELREYLGARSPSGHMNVAKAIRQVTEAISENPTIGRQSERKDIREMIEPKYGFLIPYKVIGDELFILRVYRHWRKPLNHDDISAPK